MGFQFNVEIGNFVDPLSLKNADPVDKADCRYEHALQSHRMQRETDRSRRGRPSLRAPARMTIGRTFLFP